MKTYQVTVYIRTGPHYNPGWFLTAVNQNGHTTRHQNQGRQFHAKWNRAIIARAHGVSPSDVRLSWL